MLRFLLGIMRMHRTTNEYTGTAQVGQFRDDSEGGETWFGHVQRRGAVSFRGRMVRIELQEGGLT